jgi:basic membrane protein A and related proteins
MKNKLQIVLAVMLAATMLLSACAAPQAAAPTAANTAAAPAPADTAVAPAPAATAVAPAAQPTTAAPAAPTAAPAAGSASLPCAGMKFGLITPIGGLGDGAIGDATYDGFNEAQKQLGFEFDYSEPMSAPDYESMIIDYAKTGKYNLIFLAGNDGLDPVNAVGPDYPNQKFIVYDIQAEGNQQFISEYFAKNEIGFVAGVLAAELEQKGEVTIAGKTTKFTPTGKIGLVMGIESPSTVPALTGAAAGIKYIDPNDSYLYSIVGDWKDQEKNKEVALSMYDQGVHFIFQNAGGGALGIVAAAKERNQFFVGYDTDQTKWDPTLVVGSSRKQNSAVILRVLKQYCESGGKLAWGTSELNNAANGGVGFNYNPDLTVPDDVKTTIDKVIAGLKDGSIKAPNTWDEVKAFSDKFGG